MAAAVCGLGRWRQEDQEFEVSLSHKRLEPTPKPNQTKKETAQEAVRGKPLEHRSLRLAWGIYRDPFPFYLIFKGKLV